MKRQITITKEKYAAQNKELTDEEIARIKGENVNSRN